MLFQNPKRKVKNFDITFNLGELHLTLDFVMILENGSNLT